MTAMLRNFSLHALLESQSASARLADVLTPPEWHAYAACSRVDPELWYPEVGSGDAIRAKRICRMCPVRDLCELAGRDEVYGIWGETTERQRRRTRAAADRQVAA